MKHICRLFIMLSFCFYVESAVGQTVDIPDSNLRAKIETALGKTSGATITIADMLTLTHFDFDLNANISDLTGSNLTGLEHAINLTGQGLVIDNISHLSRFGNVANLEWLFLWGNNISSVSGLSHLNSLEWLFLGDNNISSLLTLQNLNLSGLHLGTNNISRLSGLGSLHSLEWLFLGDNSISSLLTLQNLNLSGLHLGTNNISRLSGLGSLHSLEWLFLGDNSISSLLTLQNLNLSGLHLGTNNISRLSGLGSLHSLEWLFLGDNSISSLLTLQNLNLSGLHLGTNNISRLSGLGSLHSLEWLFLGDNSISSLLTLQNLNLSGLHLGTNNISRLSGLGSLHSLEWLFLGDNSISSLLTLQNLNLSGLHLGTNNITITDASFLRQRGVEVLFDEEVEPPVDTTPEVEQPVDTTPTVDIPDSNLRAKIESALGKASGAPITTADMESLTRFDAYSANISRLTGLEYATNLRWLYLYDNNIADISAVSGLTNLEWLDLKDNNILDISAVAGLANLTDLYLWGNNISDISAVRGLTNLTGLYLSGNNITDLSPLIGNTGLGGGDTVDMRANPLSSLSINTHIPTLQGRGVTVLFDAVVVPPVDTTPTVNIPDSNLRAKIETALGKARGATITTADMATLTQFDADSTNISRLTGLEYAINLTFLNLSHNNISDISPVAGLTNLIYLGFHGNNVTDLSSLLGNTGLGDGDVVDVQRNPLNSLSINTHIPTLQRRGVRVLFDAVVVPPVGTTPTVNIPDSNLRAKIEAALGKASGDTITTADMETLTTLYASSANISNLTGLEHATKLVERLDLWSNNISDISALSGLTNLTQLYIESNNISDISPLAGLTKLTYLSLDSNNISDISALSGLTNLGGLSLSSNNITDLSAVRGLTKLTYLRLDGNNISDLSALSGLTNLGGLYLSSNNISDLLPLVGNTGLGTGDTVDVRGNPLNSLSINTHIPTLQGRGVEVWFDAVVVPPVDTTPTVNIPDPNLRAKIEAALGKAAGAAITTADMATLTTLDAREPDIGMDGMMDDGMMDDGMMDDGMMADDLGMADDMSMDFPESYISNLAGLEHATNLTKLWLGGNTISDISVLSGLTNLEWLSLWGNNISDISALAGLTNLEWLELSSNNISDISVLSGLTNLTWLYLYGNTISDLSAVAGLTNLTVLRLSNNNISDISSVRGLTNLTELYLMGNTILDLSPLVGNTGLGTGDEVDVTGNPLSSLSINTHIPTLQGRGVEVWFDEEVEQPVNTTPTVSVSPASVKSASIGDQLTFSLKIVNGQNVAGYQATVAFDTSALRYISSVNGDYLPTGAFFVPPSVSGNQVTLAAMALAGEESNGDGTLATLTFEVVAVKAFTLTLSDVVLSDGTGAQIESGQIGGGVNIPEMADTMLSYTSTIPAGNSLFHVPLDVEGLDTVSDLKAMLGDSVSVAIVYDTATGAWNSGSDDVVITADLGIILLMTAETTVTFTGDPWGAGTSMISLNAGPNLIGLPVNDPRVTNISDIIGLFAPGVVASIAISTAGGFALVAAAGDANDGPVMGDTAYLITVTADATALLTGTGWSNGGMAGAAPIPLAGYNVDGQTAVLYVQGSVVDAMTGLSKERLRVKVKNLSTQASLSRLTSVELAAGGYNMTFVDLKTGYAARVGDVLEISADSPSPLIGVKPIRYIVTVDDVKRSRIQVPPLVLYGIPSETKLLPNYPNPFNPETWIPYRLAEDGFVTLTIYDGAGQIVRTLDVGHQIAAVYESQSKAIYWDGRNEVGERVASDMYFYHLSVGDYSATRRMLIIK